MKIFAGINPEFREEQRQMEIKTHLDLNKWVKIKSIEKNNDESFFFMERAGIDSVAFILVDLNSDNQIGLINQYRGSYGEFQIGAYTGSLDKEGLSVEEITIEEVLEEAGYEVTPDRVNFISKECTGSMSNERVNLFIVDVTGLVAGELSPESVFEENTENLWFTVEEAYAKTQDWKVKILISSLPSVFN